MGLKQDLMAALKEAMQNKDTLKGALFAEPVEE